MAGGYGDWWLGPVVYWLGVVAGAVRAHVSHTEFKAERKAAWSKSPPDGVASQR